MWLKATNKVRACMCLCIEVCSVQNEHFNDRMLNYRFVFFVPEASH
jgi:hypothetical protein